MQCVFCNGTGRFNRNICLKCSGSGSYCIDPDASEPDYASEPHQDIPENYEGNTEEYDDYN